MAAPLGTGLTGSARVIVIARGVVVDKGASGDGAARIVSTVIAVITVKRPGVAALSKVAVVAGSADILIIARVIVELMDAARFRVAEVGSAQVVVVTAKERLKLADAALAMVPNGALVAQITGGYVGRMNTADISATEVIGAGVAIIALEEWSGLALASGALVTTGTDTVV